MTYQEIIQPMFIGKKFRRPSWEKHKNIDRSLILYYGPTPFLNSEDLEASDWELIEEPQA